MKKLRVGIILGGMSSEKEVSLNSGRNVYDNLDADMYEGVPVFMDHAGKFWILPWQLISQNTTVDISEQLEAKARAITYEGLKDEIDFAFITLHGKYGDDGCIQGLLELLDIPYTGPGVLASALGMDKHVQQQILAAEGIHTPRSIIVKEREWHESRNDVAGRLNETLGLPVVVKPTREGSSVGVMHVTNIDQIDEAMENALRWDNTVLVEEFLEGIEFSCIVLENDGNPYVLEITEIHPQSGFFSYEEKYMPGRCRKFTPPRNFSLEVIKEIKEEVIKAYNALQFRSYGRIDGFVVKDGRILITDPNSSSGMAPSSFFFEQAAESAMLPSMIITDLIENARKIHEEKIGAL